MHTSILLIKQVIQSDQIKTIRFQTTLWSHSNYPSKSR